MDRDRHRWREREFRPLRQVPRMACIKPCSLVVRCIVTGLLPLAATGSAGGGCCVCLAVLNLALEPFRHGVGKLAKAEGGRPAELAAGTATPPLAGTASWSTLPSMRLGDGDGRSAVHCLASSQALLPARLARPGQRGAPALISPGAASEVSAGVADEAQEASSRCASFKSLRMRCFVCNSSSSAAVTLRSVRRSLRRFSSLRAISGRKAMYSSMARRSGTSGKSAKLTSTAPVTGLVRCPRRNHSWMASLS